MEIFKPDDRVRVKTENPSGTRRTPVYVRGKTGTVLTSHGIIKDYESDHRDFRGPVYSVIFACEDLFGRCTDDANAKVVVDIHEYWLKKA
ncbi:MAG: SH3-like domain-containing protein [Leptospirales bacterium]